MYKVVSKLIIRCADGQPTDYVKEANSGIVVKPGNYESLAKAILYLSDEPVIARQLGENGRKYVEEKGFDR